MKLNRVIIFQKKWPWINILSYMVGRPWRIMPNLKTDDVASLPVLNGLGFIFGLIGVVAIFIQQSLTTLLPLLVPLVVCVVLCTVLIRSQQKTTTDERNITPSPVRIARTRMRIRSTRGAVSWEPTWVSVSPTLTSWWPIAEISASTAPSDTLRIAKHGMTRTVLMMIVISEPRKVNVSQTRITWSPCAPSRVTAWKRTLKSDFDVSRYDISTNWNLKIWDLKLRF